MTGRLRDLCVYIHRWTDGISCGPLLICPTRLSRVTRAECYFTLDSWLLHYSTQIINRPPSYADGGLHPLQHPPTHQVWGGGGGQTPRVGSGWGGEGVRTPRVGWGGGGGGQTPRVGSGRKTPRVGSGGWVGWDTTCRVSGVGANTTCVCVCVGGGGGKYQVWGLAGNTTCRVMGQGGKHPRVGSGEGGQTPHVGSGGKHHV